MKLARAAVNLAGLALGLVAVIGTPILLGSFVNWLLSVGSTR